jgi:hypothetical protein
MREQGSCRTKRSDSGWEEKSRGEDGVIPDRKCRKAGRAAESRGKDWGKTEELLGHSQLKGCVQTGKGSWVKIGSMTGAMRRNGKERELGGGQGEDWGHV